MLLHLVVENAPVACFAVIVGDEKGVGQAGVILALGVNCRVDGDEGVRPFTTIRSLSGLVLYAR
jgi:hypothetical protein